MIKAILYFDGDICEEGIDRLLMPAAAKVCAKIQGEGFPADKAVIDGFFIDWGYFDSPTHLVRHVSAALGESALFRLAKDIQEENIVDADLLLTNSTFLLGFDGFTWDEEKQEFKVWFWDKNLREFRHIKDLTQKDLRRAHNIVKIYQAGGLDIHPAWLDR